MKPWIVKRTSLVACIVWLYDLYNTCLIYLSCRGSILYMFFFYSIHLPVILYLVVLRLWLIYYDLIHVFMQFLPSYILELHCRTYQNRLYFFKYFQNLGKIKLIKWNRHECFCKNQIERNGKRGNCSCLRNLRFVCIINMC